MKYKKIAIIGGSGFIGTQVAAHLAHCDRELLIPTRRRERNKEELILLINTHMVESDISRPENLQVLLKGCDAVINLTGILHGSRDQFEACHIDIPRRLVDACKAVGIRRILHMSALGADPHGPSNYLDTKAAGESIIQESGLDWTIFRPSVVYGAGDDFLNKFAHLFNLFAILPLAGAETRFQPIWVQDVARAVTAALDNAATWGKTLDLVGEKTYTLKEIAHFVGQLVGNDRPIIGLPVGMAMLQASVLQLIPGDPLMSFDSVRTLMRDSVSLQGFPSELLGFQPACMEAIAPQFLGRASSQAQLDEFRAGAHR